MWHRRRLLQWMPIWGLGAALLLVVVVFSTPATDVALALSAALCVAEHPTECLQRYGRSDRRDERKQEPSLHEHFGYELTRWAGLCRASPGCQLSLV